MRDGNGHNTHLIKESVKKPLTSNSAEMHPKMVYLGNEIQSNDSNEEGVEKLNLFIKIPTFVKRYILEIAAIEMGRERKNAGNLSLVCQEWNRTLKDDFDKNQDKIKKDWLKGLQEYYGMVTPEKEEIFNKFYNGKLTYEWLNLPIAALKNPLEGTFDLSQCGTTGRELSISTGYRKRRKPENESKLEIWIVPRFVVEKELNTTAAHFKDIFPEKWPETAHVGIFWTWYSWDVLRKYQYLTNQNMVDICNNNLKEKHEEMQPSVYTAHLPFPSYIRTQEDFYVSF